MTLLHKAFHCLSVPQLGMRCAAAALLLSRRFHATEPPRVVPRSAADAFEMVEQEIAVLPIEQLLRRCQSSSLDNTARSLSRHFLTPHAGEYDSSHAQTALRCALGKRIERECVTISNDALRLLSSGVVPAAGDINLCVEQLALMIYNAVKHQLVSDSQPATTEQSSVPAALEAPLCAFIAVVAASRKVAAKKSNFFSLARSTRQLQDVPIDQFVDRVMDAFVVYVGRWPAGTLWRASCFADIVALVAERRQGTAPSSCTVLETLFVGEVAHMILVGTLINNRHDKHRMEVDLVLLLKQCIQLLVTRLAVLEEATGVLRDDVVSLSVMASRLYQRRNGGPTAQLNPTGNEGGIVKHVINSFRLLVARLGEDEATSVQLAALSRLVLRNIVAPYVASHSLHGFDLRQLRQLVQSVCCIAPSSQLFATILSHCADVIGRADAAMLHDHCSEITDIAVSASEADCCHFILSIVVQQAQLHVLLFTTVWTRSVADALLLKRLLNAVVRGGLHIEANSLVASVRRTLEANVALLPPEGWLACCCACLLRVPGTSETIGHHLVTVALLHVSLVTANEQLLCEVIQALLSMFSVLRNSAKYVELLVALIPSLPSSTDHTTAHSAELKTLLKSIRKIRSELQH